uniref:Uncharacterized protein n=1 Tax=Neogobius melanostomus TaxID=47308 RepID=A0A8C6UI64_9GOBI
MYWDTAIRHGESKAKMEICQSGFYSEDYRTQEVPAGLDFMNYDFGGEDLSFLLDPSKSGPQALARESGFTEAQAKPSQDYCNKVHPGDGIFGLDSCQDFSWWSSYPNEVVSVEQSFHDSGTGMSYHSLVSQSSHFSPAAESSHSPYSSSPSITSIASAPGVSDQSYSCPDYWPEYSASSYTSPPPSGPVPHRPHPNASPGQRTRTALEWPNAKLHPQQRTGWTERGPSLPCLHIQALVPSSCGSSSWSCC